MTTISDEDESWLREAARTAAVTPAEDLSGTTVGRYHLERMLGRGGMGVVYLARDEKLHRVVALKLLLGAAVSDERRRKRFLRETRIAAKIVDPNIATVFDAGEDGERVFLAMEYVEGCSLRAELQENGRLAIADALRIVSSVARALARAHAEGIIHRDIKPDNVMLAKDGVVKVLDFGVAKLRDDEPSNAASNVQDSSLETRAGTLVGTPAYMSPEQAKGTGVDARSDIFSLGVVLYELVSGKRPFAGKTPLDVLIAIDRDEPAPLSRMRSDAPRWLDALVQRCLAKDPAARPQSARELLDALDAGPRSPGFSRPKALAVLLGASAISLAVAWNLRATTEERTSAPIAASGLVETATPTLTAAPPAVIETAPAPTQASPIVTVKAPARPAPKATAAASTSAQPKTKPGPLDDPK